MRQADTADAAQTATNALDELLKKYEPILDNIQTSQNPPPIPVAPAISAVDEAQAFMDELDAMFALNPAPQVQYKPQQQPSHHPAANPIHNIWDEIDRVIGKCEAEEKPEEPEITEKQLKALSRRHLFTMIYDLQGEVIRLREENAKVITAYRAGLDRKAGTGGGII